MNKQQFQDEWQKIVDAPLKSSGIGNVLDGICPAEGCGGKKFLKLSLVDFECLKCGGNFMGKETE